jgi:hypothetical protein
MHLDVAGACAACGMRVERGSLRVRQVDFTPAQLPAGDDGTTPVVPLEDPVPADLDTTLTGGIYVG